MSTTSPHDSSERKKQTQNSHEQVVQVWRRFVLSVRRDGAGSHQGADKRLATSEYPRPTATPSQERRPAKQRRCIPCPPISTSAFFVRVRQVSTSVNFDFGQFWFAPETVPNVEMKKTERKRKRKRNDKGETVNVVRCLCEGVACLRPRTPSHKHGLCPLFGMFHMNVC